MGRACIKCNITDLRGYWRTSDVGPSHWKGFRRSGECLRWGGKGLRMSRNCLIRDNKGLSQDMKKKEKEKKLTEKFPYGLVL